MASPHIRKAFNSQRWSAGKRGIAWALSFEQWLAVWQASGHFSERGRGKERYCMARKGDQGAYSVGNVEIVTNMQNGIDSRINKPSKGSRQGLGRGRGWTFKHGAYQVMVGRRYIGRFQTPELANLAYLSACGALRGAHRA